MAFGQTMLLRLVSLGRYSREMASNGSRRKLAFGRRLSQQKSNRRVQPGVAAGERRIA
jgi:hypothetical protein